MAVIYATSTDGQLGNQLMQTINSAQALSFMAFVLLYTPCLGTVAAQIKEAGSRRFGYLSLAWSLVLAWIIAFIVFQLAKLWLVPA